MSRVHPTTHHDALVCPETVAGEPAHPIAMLGRQFTITFHGNKITWKARKMEEIQEKQRKLVHVERVKSVEPIPGADFIEKARVLGWDVVVKKGDVQTGDLAAYFEIDSFIPIDERYEFLRASSYKNNEENGEGFKLRTVKLRKQLSQGLLLPLSMFQDELEGVIIAEGIDITDILNVKLYEDPIPAELRGKMMGHIPWFIQETNQERIQNVYDEYFEKYRKLTFEVTEKIDGTSCTFYWKDGHFGVCGHHYEFHEDDTNTYWEIARAIGIKNALDELARNIAVQGEAAGSKISGNRLKLVGHRFFNFDIYNIDEHRYFLPEEREEIYDILEKKCTGIEHVPVINKNCPIFMETSNIEDILRMADDWSAVNPSARREGLVFKSNELVDGDTVSFKAVNNEYLLVDVEKDNRPADEE
jgi:RNA ligase (TIGR02306 family)